MGMDDELFQLMDQGYEKQYHETKNMLHLMSWFIEVSDRGRPVPTWIQKVLEGAFREYFRAGSAGERTLDQILGLSANKKGAGNSKFAAFNKLKLDSAKTYYFQIYYSCYVWYTVSQEVACVLAHWWMRYNSESESRDIANWGNLGIDPPKPLASGTMRTYQDREWRNILRYRLKPEQQMSMIESATVEEKTKWLKKVYAFYKKNGMKPRLPPSRQINVATEIKQIEQAP